MKIKFQPILITGYGVESLRFSYKIASEEVCWYMESSAGKHSERSWDPCVLIDVAVLPVLSL